MKYKYVFGVNVIAENVLPSVKDIVDSVNTFMKGFGFDEKITLRSKLDIYTISSDKLLNDEQLRIIHNTCLSNCIDILKNHNLGVDTFLEYRKF